MIKPGGKPLYVSNLASAARGGALGTRLQKGQWLAIPYETAELSGTMLWVGPETEPDPVTIPMGVTGWHAVSVGLWSEDWTEAGVRAKLSGDPCYTFFGREKTDPLCLDERFWKYADLTGQDLVLAPSKGSPRQGAVAYVKLIPLTDAEVAEIRRQRANPAYRRLLAMNDAFSYVGAFRPTCEQDLWEWLEPYRDTDFKAILWCMGNGDLCTYDTKVGVLQAQDLGDYPRVLDRHLGESLRILIREQKIDPMRTMLDYAHRIGLEFHASFRVNAFGHPAPFGELFTGPLYTNHPEMRCADRDGAAIARMSYAFPKVRETALALIREALGYGVDGLHLIFPRSGPFVLYEEPVVTDFRREYGLDPRALPEDDPRVLDHRARYLTAFMREVRRAVDEVAGAAGRGRIPVSAHVHNDEPVNRFYGLALAAWVQEGLVDMLIPYPWEENDPSLIDMEYFRRLVEGTRCQLFPDIQPAAVKVANYFDMAARFYAAGADGLCFWDTNGYHTMVEAWPAMQVLGHEEQVEGWVREGGAFGYRHIPLSTMGGERLDRHPPHWSYCFRYRWPKQTTSGTPMTRFLQI